MSLGVAFFFLILNKRDDSEGAVFCFRLLLTTKFYFTFPVKKFHPSPAQYENGTELQGSAKEPPVGVGGGEARLQSGPMMGKISISLTTLLFCL